MQQSTSKTPCRRIGLRRIRSTSKSNPTASLQATASGNDVPNLGAAQLNKKNGGSSLLLQSCHETKPEIPSESSPIDVISSDFSSDPSKVASQDDSSKDNGGHLFKKPKLSLSVTPPTLDDLHSLQRKVTLKEKQLKELHQADIICRKHDPEKLTKEIKHWLKACQEALQELLLAANSNGNSIGMEQLLHEVGIPPELVQYNLDCEEFE